MRGEQAPSRAARLARVAIAAVGLACGFSSVARAQQDVQCDRGDILVRRLRFDGNTQFTDAQLANGIVTTPSSWARRVFRIFGARYCLDSIALRLDSLRLLVLYQRHGYPRVRVATTVKPVKPRVVDVNFRITEGPPLRLEKLTIAGLDSIPAEVRSQVLRRLPIQEGGRFDEVMLNASRDTISRRLQNNGYPRAQVLRNFDQDTVAMVATASLDAAPGPRAWIGAIKIQVTARVDSQREVTDADIRRVLRVQPGDLYRVRDLEVSKRSLYLTDAFRHVELQPDSMSIREPGDSTIDVNIAATESFLQVGRTLAGWGTLDCFRVQGDYANYNFVGGMRRLDLNARLSKIGFGYPLKVSNGNLCSKLKDDPFSDTLNYYAGATLRSPLLFRYRFLPALTLYSERRSEFRAFYRTTPIGGVATFNRDTRPTVPMSFTYRLEYGRTEAQDALFCAVFQVCTPEDRDALREFKRLAVAGWSIKWNRASNPVDPDSGSVVGLDLRHASTLIGSQRDLQFNKAVGDGAVYVAIGGGHKAVARLRAGTVFGAGQAAGVSTFIPPQERLYAGGPNSVRGFRQNELGPVVYVTEQGGPPPYDTVRVGNDAYFRAKPDSTRYRVIPIGGNTSVVANAELRLRSPLLPQFVQWAAFADAGAVWNRGGASAGLNFDRFVITPGLGVRVFTLVGPIRVDIGYNPHARPPGAAYFSDIRPKQNISRLYCVSPTNTFRVDLTKTPAEQEPGTCPPTYQPPATRTFLSRLTFNFSIGQAF